MIDFIIDPTTASNSKAKADLEAFLAAQPDADQWTLFFESLTGQALIELVAGMSSFLNYNTIAARREAYIQFATNRSSIIGAAQMLGYSSFRGKNSILKLNITPVNSGVWAKYEIIGTVKDRDLIVETATIYNAGVPVDVNIIVGSLLTEDILAPNDKLNAFRYNEKDVSEDMRMLIDGTEVSHSADAADMLDGQFLLKSNPLGSVDASYLNTVGFATRYLTGSTVRLEWVEFKDISFVLTDVGVDEAEGVLNTSESISLAVDPETDSSIAVNAPIVNETKFTVRGRLDQPKLLKPLNTTIIDTSGRDVSPAVMELFYLRENLFLFTEPEKVTLIAAFEPYRPHGIAPPLIGDPTRIPVNFKVTLVLENSSGDPINDTKAITQQSANNLEAIINLHDLEAEIEALSNIKIARIEYDSETWNSATTYEQGEIVKASPDNGFVYEVLNILYESSGVEPTWPLAEDNTIDDGEIVWITVPKDDPSGILDWTLNTQYAVGDEARPTIPNGFIYRMIDSINKSDVGEPVWTPLSGATLEDFQGTIVKDGDLLWIARPTEGTPAVWTTITHYKKGDVIEATDTGASDTVGVMWQVYAYLGITDGAQPTFPIILNDTVIDNRVEWRTMDKIQTERTALAQEYFTITEAITVT